MRAVAKQERAACGRVGVRAEGVARRGSVLHLTGSDQGVFTTFDDLHTEASTIVQYFTPASGLMGSRAIRNMFSVGRQKGEEGGE